MVNKYCRVKELGACKRQRDFLKKRKSFPNEENKKNVAEQADEKIRQENTIIKGGHVAF